MDLFFARMLDDKVLDACFLSSPRSLTTLLHNLVAVNMFSFFSSSTALSLHQAFLALSAATLVKLLSLQYSAKAFRCCWSPILDIFPRCSHASFFFLDRFLTSSVIQSASFFFGKGGRLPLASWMADLEEAHSSSILGEHGLRVTW